AAISRPTLAPTHGQAKIHLLKRVDATFSNYRDNESFYESSDPRAPAVIPVDGNMSLLIECQFSKE
ncbi:MAG: hypothetical protein ACRD9Y_09330, partial [Blastocatellia bacterium]